ncbi:hypothetical protein JX265_004322 [Neoarthrinium moseri]|uniref:Ubiquitin 3 binding protein But2 C-terminal domain-containing protein n=1 Tax=Neoarthrinium moseri TaxID=1658444 RepID=A0A9Q0ASB7_9PEZI|nr:uncharacterized protein JN550_001884 [Neoarthrinium moseri]KAI1850612.1 hypothetical protein JX266_003894 [Neoarthrinium moseri]KAI1875264.1 hypothetical protein JX265_004322 [Neoarthrinium moseri]KAI1875598.1 hypothetical protein JN550_001884 [Neoarthrinium moseri]
MYSSTLSLTAFLAAAGLSAATPIVNSRAVCLEQAPASIGFPINFSITPTNSPLVSFNVPPNSVGPCSLVAKFPAGYPITSSGSNLVNVIAVGGPAPGALVGSVRFASSPDQRTFTTINSFACRPYMEFRLEISRDQANPGSVAFQEVQGAGLFLDIGDNC